ncbi:MAG: N-acetylglutamate synthase-like GNAT family acetyltransferase [Patescibacteria group bacterium]|jgi:N-acetylglutamate synthase-like GNAT family acetyltransferase
MRFRKAKKGDVGQMFEIIKINSPKYPKKLALGELEEMFSDSLTKPTFYVAEEKGEILAFGGFSPSGMDDLIYDVFWINTDPKYMGQGIGTKLFEVLLDRIRKVKEVKVTMIMLCTKIPKYYKKFGFKVITPKYDRDYVVMGLIMG